MRIALAIQLDAQQHLPREVELRTEHRVRRALRTVELRDTVLDLEFVDALALVVAAEAALQAKSVAAVRRSVALTRPAIQAAYWAPCGLLSRSRTKDRGGSDGKVWPAANVALPWYE